MSRFNYNWQNAFNGFVRAFAPFFFPLLFSMLLLVSVWIERIGKWRMNQVYAPNVVINQWEILCHAICYSNFRFVINDNNFLLHLKSLFMFYRSFSARPHRTLNRWSMLSKLDTADNPSIRIVFKDSLELKIVHFHRVDKWNLLFICCFFFGYIPCLGHECDNLFWS